MEWGIGAKALDSIRVMSYPAGARLIADREYYATPPWDEAEAAGFIYQTWYLNRDGAGFTYEVDCVYVGTARYVSLDVSGVRQCIARWRARPDHGVAPLSLAFSCK